MWVLLTTVFVASIWGSLHCVGMCGPFALLASGTTSLSNEGASDRRRTSPWLFTGAYNVGRLATYSIVGVVFGALGLALNAGFALAAWQQVATMLAGTLMIAVGLIALGRQFGMSLPLPGVAGRLKNILHRCFKKTTQQPPFRRAFLIGGLSCLMPCGWLYTFAIVAAGTGSPIKGALVMAVFWSGTVPVLVALSLGFNRLGQAVQQRIPAVMAIMVIGIGIFTVAYRAPIAIGQETDAVVAADELPGQVTQIDQSKLPCCHGGE